jgi:glutamate:Na+ symporter, ESS family
MQSPFAFDGMIVFGWLSFMLLAGVLLRATIPQLQRFLFPSCLVGGVLGLALNQIGIIRIDANTLETWAYHFFNISFISVGLTPGNSDSIQASQGKEYFKGPAWMALVQGSSFGLQASLSGLLVIIFGLLGFELFPTFGFLVPLGFEEGPGQVLSVGKVWEGFGFSHAATIGLTFAAMGFFFSFFVGVPLVNRAVRKGLSASGPRDLSKDVLTGIISKGGHTESAGSLTLHSGNIDTLAFQTALLGLVYIFTYGLIKWAGMFLPADAARILWGFFFIIGLVTAILIRRLMTHRGWGHLIDPGIQRRVTGWAIDFLIVATVAAIQLAVVWRFILPIGVMGLVNGILTTLLVVYLGRRLSDYHLERTAAVYGAVTGTVSSGLLLLRIADPEFKTPVVIEIAIMNVFSIIPIGICLMLVNGPVWWDWSVGMTSLVFLGIMTLCLVLLKVFKYLGTAK